MEKEQFTILKDTPNVHIEIDHQTGKKIFYNKVNGRIDNARYLRDHKADFVQPVGSGEKEFARRYPERYKEFKKVNK